MSVFSASPPRVLPAPRLHHSASCHCISTETLPSSSKLLSNARALLREGSLLLRNLPSTLIAVLFKNIYLYLFIYLAVLGLSYGMQDLVPPPGTEPRLPALGAQNLSHWTPGKYPSDVFSDNIDIHLSPAPRCECPSELSLQGSLSPARAPHIRVSLPTLWVSLWAASPSDCTCHRLSGSIHIPPLVRVLLSCGCNV